MLMDSPATLRAQRRRGGSAQLLDHVVRTRFQS